ncbi:hypothetical protein OV207_12365 [Corallococcus sp. BB11-1]|uniref:hypothetical protein n=1 Tax=Corallococcus sp. BB11-1 TaxID=2996783 RepID=UPI0010CF0825|nr:hypothetical protein [Corallococcus sp. BB11-1]MCY1032255.1 hypothetical protein [Corallococcus sp. BB11-1]RYZ17564.1 MAG: hypothetical protein EOO70_01565 [Myxococcaceae bacterium]
MLTISPQQMQQFERALDKQFVGRVIEYLSQQLPEAISAVNPQALRDRVSADLQVAGAYGIRRDADLAKWCFIAFVCGSAFHQSEDVQGLLKESLMPADAKMDFLTRSLAFALAKKE